MWKDPSTEGGGNLNYDGVDMDLVGPCQQVPRERPKGPREDEDPVANGCGDAAMATA